MSNGKITLRDMVVRIDERTENIENNLKVHIANHKWFMAVVIGVPTAILTIMLIMKR